MVIIINDIGILNQKIDDLNKKVDNLKYLITKFMYNDVRIIAHGLKMKEAKVLNQIPKGKIVQKKSIKGLNGQAIGTFLVNLENKGLIKKERAFLEIKHKGVEVLRIWKLLNKKLANRL